MRQPDLRGGETETICQAIVSPTQFHPRAVKTRFIPGVLEPTQRSPVGLN
jgi:hypothetical protein